MAGGCNPFPFALVRQEEEEEERGGYFANHVWNTRLGSIISNTAGIGGSGAADSTAVFQEEAETKIVQQGYAAMPMGEADHETFDSLDFIQSELDRYKSKAFLLNEQDAHSDTLNATLTAVVSAAAGGGVPAASQSEPPPQDASPPRAQESSIVSWFSRCGSRSCLF